MSHSDPSRSVSDTAPLDLSLLRQRYQAVNATFTRTRVQQLGTGSGFCAETVGLLKAMVSCASSETRLVLATHPNGRGFALGEGWGDYFINLFPTRKGRRFGLLNRSRYPAHSHLPDQIVRLAHAASRMLLGADLLQFDPVELDDRLAIPSLGIDLDWWEGCRLCFDLLWELRPEVGIEVARHREAFGISGEYTGVHIRRGDKRQEADYVPVRAYAAAIAATSGAPTQVVVASDDARAATDLAGLLGSSYSVSALSVGQGAGYSQKTFNALPPSRRRELTIRFLAELETLRDASVLFTTTSSNVGCLLQYARARKGVIDVA